MIIRIPQRTQDDDKVGGSGSAPCCGFSTFYDASDFPRTKGKRSQDFSSIANTKVRFYHHYWNFLLHQRQNPTPSAICLLDFVCAISSGRTYWEISS
jgi:hypothetical protein